MLKAALETRLTDDVLAGQDARILKLRQANRANNAKPLKKEITLTFFFAPKTKGLHIILELCVNPELKRLH